MYPSFLRISAIFALIFECGSVTSSWYAALALRRRVKKSAIGSVIVMTAVSPFSQRFPQWACCVSPTALLHAGQLARVRHLAQADPAQPELAVHRVRAAALTAAGVGPHLELRFALSLVDQCLLCHLFSSP